MILKELKTFVVSLFQGSSFWDPGVWGPGFWRPVCWGAGFGGPAMARGVFGAGSGFRVVWRTAGGISFLFFRIFLLVLAKISFWRGDWSLG